jgi:hypothetical protein
MIGVLEERINEAYKSVLAKKDELIKMIMDKYNIKDFYELKTVYVTSLNGTVFSYNGKPILFLSDLRYGENGDISFEYREL